MSDITNEDFDRIIKKCRVQTKVNLAVFQPGHTSAFIQGHDGRGPTSVPYIFSGNRINGAECDMLIGPCGCGATHSAEEWVLVRIMP